MISFWERESFTNYDFIVVGSGIVGLSAAISYTESFPQSRVLVLERGIFPSGASTKNAGFACIGSPTELLSDLQTMTEAEVVGLVKLRYEGLNLLRQRLGDEAIDYQALGSYEILSEKELYCLERIDELNQLLFPILNGNAFSLAKSELIEQFGFNPQFVRAMVVNHFEGQIDTGKMMQSLLHLAQQKGITIRNGAEVVAFHDAQTEESGGVSVSFSLIGFMQKPLIFIKRTFATFSIWFKTPISILLALAFTWIHMLCLFGAIYVFVDDLGSHVSFWMIAGLWSLTYFITLIPISINGYGVQELSFTFFMSHLAGLTPAISLTVAVLIRAYFIFSSLPGAFFLPTALSAMADQKNRAPSDIVSG